MPNLYPHAETTTNRGPAILVLDEQTEYAKRLGRGIKKKATYPLQLTVADSLERLDDKWLESLDICLFSHGKTDALYQRRWSNQTRFYLLCDTTGPHMVSRYLPLDDLMRHILEGIDIDVAAKLQRRRGNMEIVIAFDRIFRDRYIDATLSERAKTSGTPYFLPIMPTYLLPDAETGGTGQNMSDLLLTLETTDDDDDNLLGQVFFLHSKGYFQPRPPECADDLITAPADTLFQLVRLMRRRVDKTGHDGFALIACDSLPLGTVGHIAAHCDRLTIDQVDPDSDQAGLMRKEIGQMLRSLPSSCEVREIPRHLC